jgi:hypothetical protein
MKRGQHDHGMINAICGQDGQWPVLAKPTGKQPFGKLEHSFTSFSIRDGAFSSGRLFDYENAVRSVLRPMV